jgi:hypothetical protein
MDLIQRSREDLPERPAQPAGSGGGTDSNLNAYREAAKIFSSAADEAIRRAVSSDSQSFNAAVRQEGGQ